MGFMVLSESAHGDVTDPHNVRPSHYGLLEG